VFVCFVLFVLFLNFVGQALVLMSVANNMITAKTGEPVVAAIQDFVTAL
jgi:DNA-directed RNA polymerase beta' subunit